MLLKSEIIKQSLQQTVERQQTKPLSLACKFYLTPPKSLIRKTSEPWKTTPHICKPDLDNLVKALLDACNGILYHDDSQVIEINATKEYDINPHIEIEVK
jgi:Holliday junction resolvase RusA-like endonuclease